MQEKIECTLGNKEFSFWQGKIAKKVELLFLTSGLLVLPSNYIIYALCVYFDSDVRVGS